MERFVQNYANNFHCRQANNHLGLTRQLQNQTKRPCRPDCTHPRRSFKSLSRMHLETEYNRDSCTVCPSLTDEAVPGTALMDQNATLDNSTLLPPPPQSVYAQTVVQKEAELSFMQHCANIQNNVLQQRYEVQLPVSL